MARSYSFLSDEDKLFFKENYLLLSDEKLGELFSRTPDNIRKLRQLLGLTRRGIKQKDITPPVIIWLPRKAFEDYDVDLKQLKIQGK